jgi:hypothetical protein
MNTLKNKTAKMLGVGDMLGLVYSFAYDENNRPTLTSNTEPARSCYAKHIVEFVEVTAKAEAHKQGRSSVVEVTLANGQVVHLFSDATRYVTEEKS